MDEGNERSLIYLRAYIMTEKLTFDGEVYPTIVKVEPSGVFGGGYRSNDESDDAFNR